MKAKFFTTMMFSLLSVLLIAGDLDGYWRCNDRNLQIEVLYTREGIKVRSIDRDADRWDYYNRFDNNRYRDGRGNCFSLLGSILEFCTPDRRIVYNYTRYTRNNDRWDDRGYDRGHNRDRDWNDRDWNRNDRDNWNSYYRSYEGKWHNHTTGTHIHVDLSRRSLRIKFHGERWFEVYERNRGLFVDRKGNEFIFRNDAIEFRAGNNDLSMRFYCDARCDHRDDYRADYWR